MKLFRVETTGKVEERYEYWAESEEDARTKMKNGDVPKPQVMETVDAEIDDVQEINPLTGRDVT